MLIIYSSTTFVSLLHLPLLQKEASKLHRTNGPHRQRPRLQRRFRRPRIFTVSLVWPSVAPAGEDIWAILAMCLGARILGFFGGRAGGFVARAGGFAGFLHLGQGGWDMMGLFWDEFGRFVRKCKRIRLLINSPPYEPVVQSKWEVFSS